MVIAWLLGEDGKTRSCYSRVNRMSDASLSLFTSFVFVSACLRAPKCVRVCTRARLCRVLPSLLHLDFIVFVSKLHIPIII